MEKIRQEHRLWYMSPAEDWNTALPLGGGSLGMMVFGGTEREELQLNEESLWSGYPAQWDEPACREHLPEIRDLLFAGRPQEAEALCRKYQVCLGGGSDDPYYGSYQTAGSLILEGSAPDTGGYVRELDMDRGAAETRFGPVRRVHTVSHRREVTASRVQGGGPYTLRFAREGCRVSYEEGQILVLGQQQGPGAMAFCTLVSVETDGRVTPGDGCLTITGADAFIIWTTTATTYRREEDPEALCRARLDAARAMGFEAVLAEEAAWMEEAMGRCTLALPADPALEALPTDERLERVRQGGQDLGLVRLYFDFGRYLFIGSAWGRLPANLQGVWCQDMMAPWTGDYHININLQMNYWFVDAGGLEEYGEALYRYIAFLAEHGAETARIMYGCRGWVAHVLANPWGFTAPGQDPLWGGFLCGGAWCCRHLYEHYLYTGDLDFLRRYWPVIRDSARFFADLLVEDPATGYLVTAPSSSPENSYIDPATGKKTSVCAGPTMDTAIIRELFDITLRCAAVLGQEDDLTAALPGFMERLPPYKVGKAGGIQEWMEDYEEWEPGHRHISPLYGLYPGWQISPEKTPELAAAARKTLERRLSNGGGHTGWSRAWIINFYARLGDGAAAGEHLRALLAKSTLPNLFDYHPPFQIDGNFGGTAGIFEMLVQSHDGVIRLLPALPPDWSEGRSEGVRVRGGFSLSFAWKDGHVTEGTITSRLGGTAELWLNGQSFRLDTEPGQTLPLPV